MISLLMTIDGLSLGDDWCFRRAAPFGLSQWAFGSLLTKIRLHDMRSKESSTVDAGSGGTYHNDNQTRNDYDDHSDNDDDVTAHHIALTEDRSKGRRTGGILGRN